MQHWIGQWTRRESNPTGSRFRLAPGIVCLLLWLAPILTRAATFTATLDRDTVIAGESAILTLSFEEGQPKSIPTPPSLPNLQVVDRGRLQNISGMNGRWTSTISETFELTPLQPGEYEIPALKAEVDGQVLTSQPLKLKALKPGSPGADNAGGQLAFLKLVVPKDHLYVGEVIPVQLQLYVREGVVNAEGYLQSFERLEAPAFKAEGFSILKKANATRQRIQVGNGVYNVATIVSSMFPVKTGPLTIDSINATLVLQLPARNRPQSDLFMFQQVEERRVAVAAETVKVTAQPLPPDAPAGFNGAVGSYTLSLTAGPTNVAVGEPITARIQIAGSGALDSLVLPDQPAWHDFKMYPPTTKIDSSDPLGVRGTKTFEEVVSPQSADINALPPVSFCYFDSDRKAYQTLTSSTIPLEVHPGGSVAVPTVAVANRVSRDTPSTQDIVPLKQRLGVVAQIGPPLVAQPWFLALQGVPLLALVGSIAWRRRTDMFANNPRLRRRRQVAHMVREGLVNLRAQAGENDSDAFFATVSRLLQEQLGERLDRPASAITEVVIEESLRPRGMAEPTLASLAELFQACNQARYAPIKSSQELAAMIPKVESVLGQLQEWNP